MPRLDITIPPEWADKSVKEVLKLSGVSHRQLVCMKKKPDGVLLNGRAVYVIAKVGEGDLLSVSVDDAPDAMTVMTSEGEINAVFEDEWLIVIDKPAGVPVHPAKGHPTDTLANFYAASRGGVFRPVNRLDRGTSGLMVAAKNAFIHSNLARQLHTDDFRREYLAVVHGAPVPLSGCVDAPIGRCEGATIRRQVDILGDRAVTNYETLSSNGELSLVRLVLETGRTHQIRVHMSHIGCPLAGDFLYGKEEELIGRTALHSEKIHFIHPVTGHAMDFSSPLPPDMTAIVRRITEDL